MEIVVLHHPKSLDSTSMPRFARLVGEGMRARGHSVAYWTSPHLFGRIGMRRPGLRKWLGYVDQFLLFPILLRLRLRKTPRQVLFVVVDQALGMWVPAIRERPHVIHCHDFLAQRSAVGEFPENPTSWTGRQYQTLIRRGYRMGHAFVSVSEKTRVDLHSFLPRIPECSEVVYNPLNPLFAPMARDEALRRLPPWSSRAGAGFLVHVGGDQWYKNRIGVLRIYREYSRRVESPLPLVMVGKQPGRALLELAQNCEHGGQVIFASDLSDEQVKAAYGAARGLLFPSLEEGFGWPIAEAQACGCPVVTTGCAPMSEVGGDAAIYLSRMPFERKALAEWSAQGASKMEQMLKMPFEEHENLRRKGLQNARRFQARDALDQIESIYHSILGRFEGLRSSSKSV